MGTQNPWAVENVEAFSFYCCPECDFKSKDSNHFKRHAMESHNKSEIFFIMSKSENTLSKDPMKYKNEEGIEDFIASEVRGKFEVKEVVKECEFKAKKLIIDPDLEIFDDNETADCIEENLKAEYNVKKLDTFDGANYKNITGAEKSDEETFDGIELEMEIYDENDVGKTKTFNGEIFENDEEVVTKYFSVNDEEIENLKIPENLLHEKFGQAKSEVREKPKKEKKSIISKTKECKTPKELLSDLKLSIITVQGKKAFKCNICDYSCFAKSTMNRHMESVHEGKKTFKCDICD